MPDFLSYLCRLGPQTQDNLAYNSFRNARINLSSVSAYAKSSELSQPCRFKGCYLLKLPMLTINPGAPISSPFEIAHMAVYCYLGHESSFCAVMEDSTHALNARRMLQCRDRTGPGWRRTALQQRLALCFFVLALTDWNISLDHLERLVCEKVRRPLCLSHGLVKCVLIPATPNLMVEMMAFQLLILKSCYVMIYQRRGRQS